MCHVKKGLLSRCPMKGYPWYATSNSCRAPDCMGQLLTMLPGSVVLRSGLTAGGGWGGAATLPSKLPDLRGPCCQTMLYRCLNDLITLYRAYKHAAPTRSAYTRHSSVPPGGVCHRAVDSQNLDGFRTQQDGECASGRWSPARYLDEQVSAPRAMSHGPRTPYASHRMK